MSGEILYTYAIYQAVQNGFVKHVKGLVLNPSSLRYVRREDEREVEVSPEEVRRLGAKDASRQAERRGLLLTGAIRVPAN